MLSQEAQIFYVYLHKRASDGCVFYVGKGKGKRAASKHGRNNYWRKISVKHGFEFEIILDGLSESAALEKEQQAIADLRELGHVLANLTDGGEGVSGYKFSDEVVQSRRDLMLTRNPMSDPDLKAKAMLNNYTPKRRAELSVQFKENNPMRDVDVREKMAKAQKLRLSDPAAKARHSASMKEVWSDDARKERLGETQRKRLQGSDLLEKQGVRVRNAWKDPDFRKKTTDAMKSAWSRPETKEKLSNSLRKAFSDPDFKARMQISRTIIKNHIQCSNGMVFNSAGDAVRWLAASKKTEKTNKTSAIHMACRGQRGSAYGFEWSYLT